MKLPEKVRIFSLLLILSSFFVTAGNAEDKEPPVYVEADQMSSTEEANSVLFKGNVDAQQGDLRILCDEMTVYYHGDATKDSKTSARQKIEKLVCAGNVELSNEEWLGTADKMVYYSDNRQIYLIGGAKAWQNDNMVSGERIVYYMDEGRSEVEGGTTTVIGEGADKKEQKSRVKMTIKQN